MTIPILETAVFKRKGWYEERLRLKLERSSRSVGLSLIPVRRLWIWSLRVHAFHARIQGWLGVLLSRVDVGNVRLNSSPP